MAGKKSSPDYGEIAQIQGAENREVVRDQLYANRPDQYTPWGYTNWTVQTQPNGSEKWSQTQGLTPEAQDIFNKQMAIQSGRTDVAGTLTGRMGSEFGGAMDWNGLSPPGQVPEAQYTRSEDVQTTLEDPTAMRTRAEDAIYQKGATRLGNRFGTQRQNLEIKMRNQGLGPEDAAWQAQMLSLGEQETDAYGNLQMDAITSGRGEQAQAWQEGLQGGQFTNQGNQQMFGQNLATNQQNFQQGLQGSAYANQIRQQQMTETMQQRGFSLNEINALLSGQQVNAPNMPNFAPGAAALPAPIYQAAVDQSNTQQLQNQGLWSGIGNLAGSAMGMYGMMNMGGS